MEYSPEMNHYTETDEYLNAINKNGPGKEREKENMPQNGYTSRVIRLNQQ